MTRRFPESPYGVEWMRFEADSPIPDLVKDGCPIELIEFSGTEQPDGERPNRRRP